jgi:hypothetical protein
MSPSKLKPAGDVRRTLTPRGAQIVLTDNGFEVRLDDESIAVVLWDQVQSIFAYTRFIRGHSNLCLAFVLPPRSRGEEDQVVVNDGVAGWRELVSHLPAMFSPLDSEWPVKAASDTSTATPVATIVPIYVANPVQVWPLP